MTSWQRPHKSGTLLLLYIQPGASVSGFAGLFDDRLKLKVKAPPRDGEANAAVRKFLADYFDISISKIELLRGESSRQKDVYMELSPEDVLLIYEQKSREQS